MITEIIPPLVPVESSNLAAVGYDPANETLYVSFAGGSLYAYDGVDEAVHIGLMKANSKGSFFYEHVRRAGYPYRRLADIDIGEAA